MPDQPLAIHYLPIATTLISCVFCIVLLNRYRYKKRGAHLLWWAAGVFFYGVGTGLESSITLLGNSIALTKAWYIAGALLGGYPLAQGTVYLLLRRSTANWLSAVSVPVIVIGAVLVIMSPTVAGVIEANPYRPTGDVLAWQWVRKITPFVNTYSGLFLIGGAILSAARFGKHPATRHRAIGNTLIAIGALMPAIGGTMAKWNIVEGLYVGELVGLLLIWAGYVSCVRRRTGIVEDGADLSSVRPLPVTQSAQ